MDEHWVKTLVNSPVVKIIAFILLGVLIVCVAVGLFTDKHINIIGIEFNKEASSKVADSNKSPRGIDTAFRERNKNRDNKNSGINKGIIGGSGGHVVNGVNNGINGDVTVNPEKRLTPALLNKVLNQMSKLKSEKNFSAHCVELSVALGTHDVKVAEQIRRALVSRGYTVNDVGVAMTDSVFHGVFVDIQEQCFKIIVGVI
jgi:hypothetical protein